MNCSTVKTFLINLDKSEKRLENCKKQFNNFNILFERVSAVNLSLDRDKGLRRFYNAKKNKYTYYKSLTDGEIGCYLSHRKVWQKIVQENIEYALVLEDDFLLHKGLEDIDQLLKMVVEPWDLIKLGEIPNKRIKQQILAIADLSLVKFRKIPQGTYSYLITIKGAKKMLKHSNPFSRPVDIDMQHVWEHKCNILGVLNNPFTHIDGESDLKAMGNRDKTKRRPLIKLACIVYEKIMLFFFLKKNQKL